MSCTLYILILCNKIIVHTYLLFGSGKVKEVLLVAAMLKQDLEREIKMSKVRLSKLRLSKLLCL